MNTFKIAVALNLDYSSVRLIMDKVGHDMCLKAQCAFRVAPNSCHYSNAWSTMDTLVRNIEILIEIHRHRSVNTGCPQRIDNCSSMISLSHDVLINVDVNFHDSELKVLPNSGVLPSSPICLLRGLPSSNDSQRLGHRMRYGHNL